MMKNWVLGSMAWKTNENIGRDTYNWYVDAVYRRNLSCYCRTRHSCHCSCVDQYCRRWRHRRTTGISSLNQICVNSCSPVMFLMPNLGSDWMAAVWKFSLNSKTKQKRQSIKNPLSLLIFLLQKILIRQKTICFYSSKNDSCCAIIDYVFFYYVSLSLSLSFFFKVFFFWFWFDQELCCYIIC